MLFIRGPGRQFISQSNGGKFETCTPEIETANEKMPSVLQCTCKISKSSTHPTGDAFRGIATLVHPHEFSHRAGSRAHRVWRIPCLPPWWFLCLCFALGLSTGLLWGGQPSTPSETDDLASIWTLPAFRWAEPRALRRASPPEGPARDSLPFPLDLDALRRNLDPERCASEEPTHPRCAYLGRTKGAVPPEEFLKTVEARLSELRITAELDAAS